MNKIEKYKQLEEEKRKLGVCPGYIFAVGSSSGFGEFKGFHSIDECLKEVRRLFMKCDGSGELMVKKTYDPEAPDE